MLGVGLIAPLIPLYSQSLGATGLMIGVIIAGYSISKALVMPLIGTFSDKRGRRFFLILGLACYTLLSLAYVVATNAYALALVRIVHGVAGGMVLPVARAYIGDITPVGQESRWQGYFNTVWFGGMGFGPVMGGFLTDFFGGMNAAFFGMGLFSLIACIAVVIFLPETLEHKNKKRPKVSYRAMARSGVFKGVFSIKVLESIGRRGFFSFLPIFAAGVVGLSTTQIGILLTTDVIISAALQAPAGRLADMVNKRTMVIMASTIGAAYMAMTVFALNFWLLFSVVIVAGLRASLTSGGTAGLMVEEGRKYGMATTMAMFSMAVSIGEGLGPLWGGAIVDLFGITGNFYAAAGMMLVAGGIFAWFTRTKKARAETISATPADGRALPKPLTDEEDVS